jgi:glucose-6-phosphate 1-dehydrogenase
MAQLSPAAGGAVWSGFVRCSGHEGRGEPARHRGGTVDHTHLFQVLGFVAMEPPATLAAEHVRDVTTTVFHAMRPLDATGVVRGQ